MTNSIKFSIIIPVYNTRSDVLKYAIQSAIDINYDNYEIIIVDDGSNAKTKEVLKQFKEHCLIIHKENGGLVNARLRGLKEAKGDYIIFLDSDDYIDKESLTNLETVITRYSSEVIIYNFPHFKNDINDAYPPTYYMNEGVVSKSEVINQICNLHINSINGKICKKELFLGIENSINTKIMNGEDLQQSTYVVLKADNFYYAKFPIEYYRLPLEHREYYNLKSIVRDSNFLVRPYEMLFEENQNLNYKKNYIYNAKKSVVYDSFRIILFAEKSQRNDLLNGLNNQQIIKILSMENSTLIIDLLFSILTNKKYKLLYIITKIYNTIFKVDYI